MRGRDEAKFVRERAGTDDGCVKGCRAVVFVVASARSTFFSFPYEAVLLLGGFGGKLE